MKILFLTPSIPSRLHRIRSYQLIKYLSRYHQLHLISLLPANQEPFQLTRLARYCEDIQIIKHPWQQSLNTCLQSLGSPIPLEVAYCQSAKMQQAVKEAAQTIKPDLVYVKRLRMIPNVLPVSHLPTVIDAIDAMSLYYQRALPTVTWSKKLLYQHEAKTYAQYEQKALKLFKQWVVSAPEDQDYLHRKAPYGTTVSLIPNGVDTEYYPYSFKPSSPTLLFSGLMNKHVNESAALWLVEKVLPLILKENPAVRLMLVGPKPTAMVRSLASTKIKVTGLVNDLRTYIEQASVVVCPMKLGTGSSNKILQAWSMGTPVVSTVVGARGLEYVAGQELLLADSPEAFAEAVLRVLNSVVLQEELAVKARARVVETYSLDAIIPTVNKLVENASRPALKIHSLPPLLFEGLV